MIFENKKLTIGDKLLLLKKYELKVILEQKLKNQINKSSIKPFWKLYEK